MNKPVKAYGGRGMLTQQAAMISKAPTKPSAESLLQPNPPSPAGSIASMSSHPGSAQKRKRGGDTPRTPLYTAPTPAETGQSMLAQMTFAVEYLKSKRGEAQTLEQIINYLSLRDEDRIKDLVRGMRANKGIAFVPGGGSAGAGAGGASGNGNGGNKTAAAEQIAPPPDPDDWRTGTYAHLAKLPGVRDKVSLLEYLRKRTDYHGVSVKDIRDGWPDCEKTLSELEKEHQLLVIRTKKDNHARSVWLDVQSLHHDVEPEVMAAWHKVPLPSIDDMPRELMKEGQKPSSQEPKASKVNFGNKTKKKAARKSAKTTNTHLAGLLQDYSHMGRRAV